MTTQVSTETQTTGADNREAERTPLELRPAKLICQSGEYFCQIRDVSTLGVGLVFLHTVPPEPRMILQLANGFTYPVERVWIGKRQAGFRFAAEVSLEEFVSEGSTDTHNAPLRLKVRALAEITNGRQKTGVELTEIGCEGIRVESSEDLPFNRLIAFELDGLPPQLGEVRWKDGQHYGLDFQHPLSEAELAQCALHLQPFGTSFPSGFAGLLDAARAA